MVVPAVPIIVRIVVARSRAFSIEYRDRTVIIMMMMLVDRDRRGEVRDLVLIPSRRRPGQRQGNHGESEKGAE